MPVPSPAAKWRAISEFAVTINGYEEPAFEGVGGVGTIANAVHAEWQRTRSIPDDLMELRGCLFFEQRRAGKYTDFDPWVEWDSPNPSCGDWIEYIQALVEKISLLSGGTVEIRNSKWEPFPDGLR
jgi:hypothetical protein